MGTGRRGEKIMPICSRCGNAIDKMEDFKASDDVFTFGGKVPDVYDGVICMSCGLVECSNCRDAAADGSCSHCGGKVQPAYESLLTWQSISSKMAQQNGAPSQAAVQFPADQKNGMQLRAGARNAFLNYLLGAAVIAGVAFFMIYMAMSAFKIELLCELEAGGSPEQLSKTASMIGDRIKDYGVNNTVNAMGDRTIKVSLPQGTNVDDIIETINCNDSFRLCRVARVASSMNENVGTDEEILTSPEVNSRIYVVDKKVLMTGSSLKEARMDESGVQKAILLVFNEEGTKVLGEVTGKNIGQRVAFIVNGKVITAPVITGPITAGRAHITGEQGANLPKYFAMINARPLPLKIKKITRADKSIDR